MTIDELLENARVYCHLADLEMGRDLGSLVKATQYATIAQANSTTAIAMMMRETGNERTVVIKTGETAISRGVTF